MTKTRFNSKSRINPKSRPIVASNLRSKRVLDLKGLDMVLPDEISKDGSSPLLKNARYYAEKDASKRVAISTRKGPAYLTTPVGETEDDTEVSTTGAADTELSTTTWLAEKFTTTTAGRLTKVELNLKENDSNGPIIVKIYADNSGEPGTLLATSSILDSGLGASAAYLTARLIEAPQVANATDYWVVAHLQDNGTGSAYWTSTTNTTTGLTSSDSGSTWASASKSFNFKTHISTDISFTGYFAREQRGSSEIIVAANGSIYIVDEATGGLTSIRTGLSASATNYTFANILGSTYISNASDTVTKWDGVSIETDTKVPAARILKEHKNRLFAVVSETEVRWSGSNTDLNDINTWLSTSFFHVPSPFTGDPITALIGYQDGLVIFTENNKYVLTGSDPATFNLSDAIGSKGAVGPNAVTSDGNYLYFISDDGVYRFDGSQDKLISESIEPLFSEIAAIETASLTYFDKKLRLYYRDAGQGWHNNMALYDVVYEDWFNDTGVFCKDAFVFGSKLIEVSSLSASLYNAEQQYSDMGKPIEFEYRTKYFSFGQPTMNKIIRRFYPILRAQSDPFNLQVQLARDFNDTPYTTTNVAMQASGDTWDGGDLWDSTFAYGSSPFLRKRIPGNGDGSYIQARFKRTGVNNPVEIVGYEWKFKYKRSR